MNGEASERRDEWRSSRWLAVVMLVAATLSLASPVRAQNLGACRAGGDIDAAIAACTAVIDRGEATMSSERRGYAHYVRGLLRRQRLEYPEAIDDFTRAFELNRKDVASLFNRGEVRALIGILVDGEADVREALRLAPRSAPAHSALGRVLLQLSRHAEALGAFEQALAIDGRERGALIGRAQALSRLARHREAEQAFAAAIAAHPNDTEIRREQQLAIALARPTEVATAPPVTAPPVATLPPPAPPSGSPPGSVPSPRQPPVEVRTPPARRDQEPAAPPVSVANRSDVPPTLPRLDAPIPDAIAPTGPRGADSPSSVTPVQQPPLERRIEVARPPVETAPRAPRQDAGPSRQLAEAPRGGDPGPAVPSSPPAASGPAPVALARAPFYCGMVESWRDHAARYSGVRLDALGCGSR